MTDVPRLCVNCKHVGPVRGDSPEDRLCHHPDFVLVKTSLVTGTEITNSKDHRSYFCQRERTENGSCGPNGNKYEQRPPPKMLLPLGACPRDWVE